MLTTIYQCLMYMLSTEDRLTLMLTAVYTYLMYIMYTWDLLKTLWGVTTNDQNLLAAVDNTLEVLYPELCILMQKCCFVLPLTAHNWQKWKRGFLTCPCHKIYRDEAVGLKSCKYTWKITIFMKMWNLGQYRENLIFCQ